MQKRFWLWSSALGLVLAVGDSITAATSPNFNVSTMAADSYLSSRQNLLDVDHQGYLAKGMYANYFTAEMQYKDEMPNQITIRSVKVDNAPFCTTPGQGPTEAEAANTGALDSVLHRARSLPIAKHAYGRHVLHGFGPAGAVDAPRFSCDDHLTRPGSKLRFTHS